MWEAMLTLCEHDVVARDEVLEGVLLQLGDIRSGGYGGRDDSAPEEALDRRHVD